MNIWIFGYDRSGAKVAMASSGETLRRNTVHNTNNNNNSGHNKQQQQDNEDPAAPLLTLPDDFREQVGSRPISPNVTVANRRRSQLKKFSQSTPALQLHHDLNNLGRYKSRQKKFLRLFPDVSRDECVLNCKSSFKLWLPHVSFGPIVLFQIMLVPWWAIFYYRDICTLHTITLHFIQMCSDMSPRCARWELLVIRQIVCNQGFPITDTDSSC